MMMRFVGIFAVAFVALSCASPRISTQREWERRLGKITVGEDASALVQSLEAKRYPTRWIPTEPTEIRHVAYFLEGGEIHVITRTAATGQSVIAERPCFVSTDATVKKCLEQADREWDEYAKRHTAR